VSCLLEVVELPKLIMRAFLHGQILADCNSQTEQADTEQTQSECQPQKPQDVNCSRTHENEAWKLYGIVQRLSVFPLFSVLSPCIINNLRVINGLYGFDSHPRLHKSPMSHSLNPISRY
jgi:hypothetical protein